MDIVRTLFSHAYNQQEPWPFGHPWTDIDFRSLPGTDCYCDEEAVAYILGRIQDYPITALHLIDSGNYHYMTNLWLRRVHEPYQLLVYDNHTDMQPSAFGEILSCGSWVLDLIRHSRGLDQVLLVGPEEEDFRQVPSDACGKVVFISKENLNCLRGQSDPEKHAAAIAACYRCLVPGLPLYISVDKDILSPQYAMTGWSQGDMTLSDLKTHIRAALMELRKRGGSLLGADLCGELSQDQESPEGSRLNAAANRALAKLILSQEGGIPL